MSANVCDFAVLETLDSLPMPVPSEDVAIYVQTFWAAAPKDDTARISAVQAALDRLFSTGDVAKQPTRKRGLVWSITAAGRNTSRNA